jgi:nucleotide-binding universal stress UspA family protein
MTYAGVIVHAQAGKAGEARLMCARALADSFDATLIGVGAQAVPPAPFADPSGALSGEWFVAMRDEIERELKAARAAFNEAACNLSRPAIWECGLQLPGPAVARASRAADIIVAGAPADGRIDPFSAVRPGELAIEAGRPVLVVPDGATQLDARRIVLAWKDTREARRALSDAMPFLERAEEVLVVEVCGEEDQEDARIRTDDVAAALVRRGVVAKAKVVVHEPADAHQILRQASLIGAGLIVAGAYGHGRLGEWVFGGVTRDLLDQTDRFLLLSH